MFLLLVLEIKLVLFFILHIIILSIVRFFDCFNNFNNFGRDTGKKVCFVNIKHSVWKRNKMTVWKTYEQSLVLHKIHNFMKQIKSVNHYCLI